MDEKENLKNMREAKEKWEKNTLKPAL